MAKPRRLPKKTVVTIEGEKAAICTTGCRKRGSVLFRHRYHLEAEEKKTFL
jgi:hypothetical protein